MACPSAQWYMPLQWPIWNPWVDQPFQEGESTPSSPLEWGSIPGAEIGTKMQDTPPWDPPATEEVQRSVLVEASSSSSPGEAMVGMAMTPAQGDYRLHQELLHASLGIQVEQISELAHALVNILTLWGPSRVVLPLNDTILEPNNAQWQTAASLQPMAKLMQRKYFVPPKGNEYQYTHSPLGSLVVALANERERQEQWGPIA